MENKQEVERIQIEIGKALLEFRRKQGKSDYTIAAAISQILAIPELCIKADDQSLPTHEYMFLDGHQAKMLKPDKDGCVWVKVIPKGGK